MLKRFKATSATQDAQFILTKLDDGVGLVKVNKDTGAIEKEIILKDKKPAIILTCEFKFQIQVFLFSFHMVQIMFY